jgi:hypothetical protein
MKTMTHSSRRARCCPRRRGFRAPVGMDAVMILGRGTDNGVRAADEHVRRFADELVRGILTSTGERPSVSRSETGRPSAGEPLAPR